MAWVAVGGAAVSAIGNIAGASADAENAAQTRQEDREFEQWKMQAGRQDAMWNAQNAQGLYNANRDNLNASDRTNAAMQMHASKYSVANQQARFDAFEKEFGSVKDNVNNYFKTLSASSVKAQNNDAINARVAGVDARLAQSMAERGISSSSGIAIQALASNMIGGEMEKVQANRNVETEIAGVQSDFLTAQANNPLLARAPDWDAGILTEGEKDKLVTDRTASYDIAEQQALPDMPSVQAPEASGIGGVFGSLF